MDILVVELMSILIAQHSSVVIIVGLGVPVNAITVPITTQEI